jgi:hypothetical protein
MSEDDGIAYKYEATVVVKVEVWAYDEHDARKLISSSHRNWNDWWFEEITQIERVAEK